MRATSAVLDASLFLLFVTAALTTLSLSAPPLASPGTADGAASVLATSTATVNYSLAPGAKHADETLVEFGHTQGPEFDRVAHGTLAGHLAQAAVGNVSVAGEQVTHTWDEYERATRDATRNATRERTRLVGVRAVWEPYRDAPVAGRITVGPSPPRDAAVDASTLTADSGMEEVRDRGLEAARRGGYDAVARVVARATVEGLFPPRTTRLALEGDYPVDALVTYRYRRFGTLLGVNLARPLARRNATAANARLATTLERRFAADMRRRFESPVAAARAVSVGTVRITVRRWQP